MATGEYLDLGCPSGARSKEAKDLPSYSEWRLERARLKEMTILLQDYGTVGRVWVKQEVVPEPAVIGGEQAAEYAQKNHHLPLWLRIHVRQVQTGPCERARAREREIERGREGGRKRGERKSGRRQSAATTETQSGASAESS